MGTDGWNTNETSETAETGYPQCLTFYILIAALGLLANIVTIAVLYRGINFGKYIKIQLINLAIADLLGALLVLPTGFLSSCIRVPYPDSDVLCKAHFYLTLVITYGALLSKTAIGLERLVAVYMPLKMVEYRKRHVIAVIAFSWILSSALNIDLLFTSAVVTDASHIGRSFCRLHKDMHILEYQITAPFYMVKFLVPSIVITTAYVMIIYKLRNSQRGASFINYRRQNKKVVVMLTVDAAVTVATWTPSVIWLLLDSMQYYVEHYKTKDFAVLFVTLPLVNCFITPVIYLLFNADYRMDSVNLFTGGLVRLVHRYKSSTKSKHSGSGSTINIEVISSKYISQPAENQ